MSDLERIEAAMEEKVRPALRSHGGDISIDHVEGKTVYVKLCARPLAHAVERTLFSVTFVQSLSPSK